MSSFDLDSILGRVASIAGVTKDSELAEVLGVTRQTLSKWKQRETIPYEKVIEFAISSDISLDNLLLGKEAHNKRSRVDVRLMAWIYSRFSANPKHDSLIFLFEDNPPAHAAEIYNLVIESGIDKDIPEHYLTENFKKILDGVIALYKQQLDQELEKEVTALEELNRRINESNTKQQSSNTANQSFHGSVGQVAGRDINNKENK